MGIIKSYTRISNKAIEKLKFIKSENELKAILDNSKEHFDIDKSWQALNFLITGELDFSDHVFTRLIYPNNHTIKISDAEEAILEDYYENGMQEVTGEIRRIELKEELSLGFVDLEELRAIISELEKIGIDAIIEKADFDTFNEIGVYPANWSNSTEHKDYVTMHYNNLFSFLLRAKMEADCVIVY